MGTGTLATSLQQEKNTVKKELSTAEIYKLFILVAL